VRRPKWLSAPLLSLELKMNIESIQMSSPPQRLATREPAPKSTQAGTNSIARGQPTEKLKEADAKNADSQLEKLSVQDAVKRLSEFVASTNSEINFSVDQVSGVQVVKVMDKQSGDVIRQFPSEEAIQLAQVLDKIQGLLVKDKA
jgi:flagellar protein FlaG